MGLNIYVREKPVNMLIILYNFFYNKGTKEQNEVIYPSQLAKETDITYSHVVKLLQGMEKDGIVHFEKKVGRLKPIGLTEDGKILVRSLISIKTILENH